MLLRRADALGRLERGADGSPTYLQARRREMYRAALETAESIGPTQKHVRMLAQLRDGLGITPAEAARLEAQVRMERA